MTYFPPKTGEPVLLSISKSILSEVEGVFVTEAESSLGMLTMSGKLYSRALTADSQVKIKKDTYLQNRKTLRI